MGTEKWLYDVPKRTTMQETEKPRQGTNTNGAHELQSGDHEMLLFLFCMRAETRLGLLFFHASWCFAFYRHMWARHPFHCWTLLQKHHAFLDLPETPIILEHIIDTHYSAERR